MNNSSLGHAFAHHKETGKGSNMFIEGKTIYSYGGHFPIASWYDDNTVLFTSNDYSMSTSKHKYHVYRALIGNNYTIFTVPQVYQHKYGGILKDHSNNLLYLAQQVSKTKNKIKRAKIYKDHYINQTEKNYNTLLEYIKHFKLKKKDYPKQVYKFLKQYENGIFSSDEKDIFQKQIEQQKEKAKKAKQLREKLIQKRLKQDIIDFRNHEKSGIHFPYDSKYNAVLRLSKDNTTIQSSMGISVSVTMAKRIYRQKKNNETLENITDIHGTNYSINKWNGGFFAGCHRINNDEIENIAKILNW